ncbi:MAG: protealysin inhibitor emfourin [Candidatus Competibacteraceae bacterium]
MHVQFTTEGGIAYLPGLSKPVTIDSEQLAPAEAAELNRLIEATHFFERPAQIRGVPPGAADYQRYTIVVEEGGRKHTVQLTDPVQDPEFQKLLNFLKSQAKAQRAGERARSSE